jgi:uncharacterized protein YndB with AHSA1/START domain
MSDRTASEAAPQGAPNAVVTECDLPEAPEKVWRALTVPKLLAAWLPEAAQSEILEAQPNRLLRYRWAGGEQDRDADGRRLESVVTFELTDTADGGTHLRVVHRVMAEARVIPFGPRLKHRTLAMAGGAPGMTVGSDATAHRSGTHITGALADILLRRAA